MPRRKGGINPAPAACASSRARAKMASASDGDEGVAGVDALVCVCMAR
jgi:hypothetical protein